MQQKELLASVEKTFKENLDIMRVKNLDYSRGDDALRNFRECERVGVPVVTGIFIRFQDKYNRLLSLIGSTGGPAVKSESISDTISDAINYLAIMKAVLESESGTKSVVSDEEVAEKIERANDEFLRLLKEQEEERRKMYPNVVRELPFSRDKKEWDRRGLTPFPVTCGTTTKSPDTVCVNGPFVYGSNMLVQPRESDNEKPES